VGTSPHSWRPPRFGGAGLRRLPGIGLDRLPRMADFALWAAACETALWPSGTFAPAYEANRRAAIEGIVDADPVAALVRQIMAQRSAWTGSAADLLRLGSSGGSDGDARNSAGWPKNPRARRPLASGADVFADIGHRDYVQSRRPSGKPGHPDAHYY